MFFCAQGTVIAAAADGAAGGHRYGYYHLRWCGGRGGVADSENRWTAREVDMSSVTILPVLTIRRVCVMVGAPHN